MYHYDDRYYWAPECAECDVEITARTVAELEQLMAEHNCSQPGQGCVAMRHARDVKIDQIHRKN